MGIKDDTLCICFCIADTKGKEKIIIGFAHGSILRLMVMVLKSRLSGSGFKIHIFIKLRELER
jgi:hypothetical protein